MVVTGGEKFCNRTLGGAGGVIGGGGKKKPKPVEKKRYRYLLATPRGGSTDFTPGRKKKKGKNALVIKKGPNQRGGNQGPNLQKPRHKGCNGLMCGAGKKNDLWRGGGTKLSGRGMVYQSSKRGGE